MKKLNLAKETLVSLNPEQAQGVNGGLILFTTACTNGCPNYTINCTGTCVCGTRGVICQGSGTNFPHGNIC